MEFQHRSKCKVLAWISLVVWICELFWHAFTMILVELGYKTADKPDADDPLLVHFPMIMNDMGWKMAFPLIYCGYLVAFIAQIGVSCILIKGCKPESSLKAEAGACHCWARISMFGILSLLSVYIFRPLISIYPFDLSCLLLRILFQVIGILIVKLHASEIKVEIISGSNQV